MDIPHVLIIVVRNGNESVSVTTQEFTTKENAQQAKRAIDGNPGYCIGIAPTVVPK